jgi:hypothetical protein
MRATRTSNIGISKTTMRIIFAIRTQDLLYTNFEFNFLSFGSQGIINVSHRAGYPKRK